MTMSDAEEADLVKLKEANAKERELFFGMVREIIHADAEVMAVMGLGRKTKAEAVYEYAQDTLARIEKNSVAFVRKWPD